MAAWIGDVVTLALLVWLAFHAGAWLWARALAARDTRRINAYLRASRRAYQRGEALPLPPTLARQTLAEVAVWQEVIRRRQRRRW